jgi:hypothetical protein
MSWDSVKQEAAVLETKFSNEWGVVRRFISLHPLTGAWGFFTVGLVAGWLFGKL